MKVGQATTLVNEIERREIVFVRKRSRDLVDRFGLGRYSLMFQSSDICSSVARAELSSASSDIPIASISAYFMAALRLQATTLAM